MVERRVELQGRISKLDIWNRGSPFQNNLRYSWQKLHLFDDFRHNWRTTTFVYSSKTTKGQAGIFANKKAEFARCKLDKNGELYYVWLKVHIKKVKEYWNKTLLNQPILSVS